MNELWNPPPPTYVERVAGWNAWWKKQNPYPGDNMTEESERAAEQVAEDFRRRHHHHHFPDEWIAECAYYISIGENPSNIAPSSSEGDWFNAETWLGWNHHAPNE